MDWTKANCKGMDPNLFVKYDPVTFSEIDPPKEIQDVCFACDILVPCREFAIETRQEGYWGGTSFRNRDRIRRKRREANPITPD